MKEKTYTRSRIYIGVISGILLMFFTAVPIGINAAGEASEDLGSIEITGEAKDKIRIDKVVPEISIEIREIVDSVTDKTEKLLEKGKPVPSPEDFEQFNHLASRQTARPWLPDFSEPPLIRFYPAVSQTTVKVWRLEVTDERGNIIHTLKGKGNPVREIVWDGWYSRGKILKVGAHYSYRFITIDEFKNAHTTLGKAFRLQNLRYRDRKNLYLEISNKLLFDDARIKPEARILLDKVIDILREYSAYPFTVEYYTKDPRGEQVRKRKETISQKVAEEMLLLPEDVRYAYPKKGDRGDITRFVINLRRG